MLLAVIVFGLALYGIYCCLAEDSPAKQIKRYKKRNTPSCKYCEYMSADSIGVTYKNNGSYDKFNCCCPSALDHYEREHCRTINSVDSNNVRGSKYCDYSRRTEEEKVEND